MLALSALLLPALSLLTAAQSQGATPPARLNNVVERSPYPSVAAAPSITPRALPVDYQIWTASGVPHTTKILDEKTSYEISCTGSMAEYECLMGVQRIYECCISQGRGQACNVLAGPLDQNCFHTGKQTYRCAGQAGAERNECCETAFASMFEGGNREGEEECGV